MRLQNVRREGLLIVYKVGEIWQMTGVLMYSGYGVGLVNNRSR